MKKFLRIFLFCFVISVASQAFAIISITLDPHPKNVHATQNVFVDINISGLQSNGVNALLGAWELDFIYDPNVFQFLAAAPAGFGASLGSVALGEAISLVQSITTEGVFHVGMLSLLEADAATCVFCTSPFLEDLQSDSFRLATVGFHAPSIGDAGTVSSSFEINNIILSDAFGNELSPIAHLPVSIKVVPIPATIMLIGIGLLGWLAVACLRALSLSPVAREALV